MLRAIPIIVFGTIFNWSFRQFSTYRHAVHVLIARRCVSSSFFTTIFVHFHSFSTALLFIPIATKLVAPTNVIRRRFSYIQNNPKRPMV